MTESFPILLPLLRGPLPLHAFEASAQSGQASAAGKGSDPHWAGALRLWPGLPDAPAEGFFCPDTYPFSPREAVACLGDLQQMGDAALSGLPVGAAAAGNVRAARRSSEMAMISGLENSAEDRMLRRTCQEYGISLSRVYRSDGIDTNMRLVRDGMGVVLGPESFASYYGVSAVPLHPETVVSLKFICLQSGMKKKDVQLFRSYLCGVCRRRGTACERCTSPCT